MLQGSVCIDMETGLGIEPNSVPFTVSSTGLKPAAGASQLNQSNRFSIYH